MYYISHIKFRGFKSFKSAEASLSNGFVALAGPNGSGKSNVTDAIRFIFGEMSLKALRAKKTAELINLSSNSAEVVVSIDGDKHFEIRRQIHEDGTTRYELDGRHLTRDATLEALRPFGLEVGPHNIIAQGQVQNLVERHPKDRRAIIDAVAGIAEFDEKKKDALSQLARVDSNISEARVVLAERGAFLAELEKERDAALAFQEAKATLEHARATLVSAEYKKLDSYFRELLEKRQTLSTEISRLETELVASQSKRAELDKQRAALSDRIGKSGEREKLLAAIAETRLQLASLATRLEEKKGEQERLNARQTELEASRSRMDAAIVQMKSDAASLDNQFAKAAAELETARQAAGISSPDGHSGEAQSIDQLESALQKSISDKSASEASLQQLEAMIGKYSQEAKRAAEESKSLGAPQAEDERLGRLTGQIKSLGAGLEKLFDEEKKLNRSLPDLDQSLLQAKEKVATLRGSVSPAAANPALLLVQSLKSSMGGIKGVVSELISVDSDYRQAVEAAGSGRLNYIVVDTLDTASEIISKLKNAKAGRATFIPLDSVVLSEKAGPVPSGALGRLIDFIRYDPALDSAMRYCFEDTLLVNDVDSAKKIGVGRARMVSLGGELLERSGVISGGHLRGSLMSRASLEKAEGDVERIKADRDAMYSKLYSVREEMARLRRERAEAELKLAGLSAELGGAGRRAAAEAAKAESQRWQEQLENSTKERDATAKKLQELTRTHSDLSARLAAAKAAVEAARHARAKASGAAQERFRNAVEKHSQAEGLLRTKRHELEMVEGQKKELAEQLAGCKKSHQQLAAFITQTESQRAESAARHATQEEQLQAVSATVKKYYDQMQHLQSQLDELGASGGKLQFALDSANRSAHDNDVKRAGAETKLIDLKAEWEKYKDTPLLEVGREKAEELVRESEQKLQVLGNVNQKAPEMYVQKKKEIEEVQGRVETLASERAAVIGLMEEIESRKRNVFMETFSRVNTHFKRLFGMVYAGEGTLILDDPNNPLESGLSIRVRGLNDKRDKYLESMSGGEKTLLGMMFIFALHTHKPSPFYILDEAEASLDKENARKLADFISQMSKQAQFIVVTHNDSILSAADVVLGVTNDEGGSRLVGVHLTVGGQFVKKEMEAGAGGSRGNGAGSIKTVAGGPSASSRGAGLSSGSPPAPGQMSDSGLKNPAKLVSEATIRKKKSK